MSFLVREYVRRDGRGKLRRFATFAGFDYPGIFDTPYDPTQHRQVILRELRYRTGRPPAFLGRNKKKGQRLSKYERHVPSEWKAAILRDAPLLKGFFDEEPQWRDKMLRWCEENLIPETRSTANKSDSCITGHVESLVGTCLSSALIVTWA